MFMNGSMQDAFSGAADIFEDSHVPFGRTSLHFPLGPYQLSTDDELTGICGALSRFSQLQEWHRATLVIDSQAAIQMI